MIYVGYQGIGKSSIGGIKKYIDLESGNFWIDGKRDENWYKIYVNIAENLNSQCYDVLLSSHKVVRDELKERNIPFTCVYPGLNLKDQWIDRLLTRYNITLKEKDYKALCNAIKEYIPNITDLSQEENTIEINSMNYELSELLEGTYVER